MNWEKIDRKVSVAGLVTDKEIQMPIAGARVDIDGPRPDRTESRGDGSYFFLDLPDGKYSLEVSAPGLGTRYGTGKIGVTLPLEESQRLNTDLKLPPTCITGKVTDTETGDAIRGASIRLRADANVTLTNDDGRFTLGPLVASQPTIRVSAPNYETQDVRLLKKLEPGKEKKVTIKLKTDSQE